MEPALVSSQRIIDTQSLMVPSPKSLLLVGMEWSGSKPRGMDRYVYHCTQELCKLQHRVEFCGVGVSPSLNVPVGAQLTNLASPDSPVLPRLRRIRKEFLNRPPTPVDAVSLHFALYSFPIMRHLPKDVPVTFTFHGPWFQESQNTAQVTWKNRLQRSLEQYVYDRCDRFIVMSKSFGQLLNQIYRVPDHNIHVIPPGVRLDWFHPVANRQNLRTQLNWPQDRFIVFTARRFVQRMGIQPLIAAIDRVRKQHPEILLAIAGSGELAGALQQQVRELGLDNHVKFLGFLPDHTLRQCYQAADLTVVPSQYLEGFGLIVIESLACGTPVLCTPVGGMQEIMAPLAPDLITPSCHTPDIAAHLSAILRGDLPLPSASQCRTHVENHFNWAKITRQVEAVLFKDT
jgi:glycosyltransferase involved in cell wall biosynthesis